MFTGAYTMGYTRILYLNCSQDTLYLRGLSEVNTAQHSVQNCDLLALH